MGKPNVQEWTISLRRLRRSKNTSRGEKGLTFDWGFITPDFNFTNLKNYTPRYIFKYRLSLNIL